MLVNDLSYLENASENKLILGGASASIVANASAKGNNSLAMTDTDLTLKALGNGGSKVKGTGTALAIGSNPIADVSYELDGFDKGKVKTLSLQGENFDLEIVSVKAIDRPNK